MLHEIANVYAAFFVVTTTRTHQKKNITERKESNYNFETTKNTHNERTSAKKNISHKKDDIN